MTNDQIILLVYAILLELGGAMGFIKAGSKASLIASSVFVAIILLFTFVFPVKAALWVLGFLFFFFLRRLIKTKKMMPNGVMVLLTVLAFIFVWLF